MKKVILVGIFLLTFPTLAQVELIFKPTKGTTKKISLISNMVMEMNFGGKKISMPMLIEQFTNATVKDVDTSGNVTFEYRIRRIVYQSTDPETQKMSRYDSDSIQNTEEYKEMDEQFRPALKTPLICIYDKQGKLISTNGNKSPLEEIWIKLPASKVKVNDTWIDNFSREESGMKIDGTTTYKVIEINKTEAVVEGTTTGTLIPKPMKTLAYVDLKSGLINSSSAEGTMALMMTMNMKLDVKVE